MKQLSKEQAVVLLSALFADIGVLQWRSEETEQTDISELSVRLVNELLSSLIPDADVVERVSATIRQAGTSEERLIRQARDTHIAESGAGGGKSLFRKPLISVLSRVSLDESHRQQMAYYLPKPLSPKDIFPEHTKAGSPSDVDFDPAESRRLHKKLFADFKQEFSLLVFQGYDALIEDILFLFEKYFTTVNAASQATYPDISLYDHAKSVAALATAFAGADDTAQPFILFAADISGIQSFIYDNKKLEFDSGGKAKRLRGKSFYITLLTDTVSDYLIRRAGVTRASVLMNGGGHFILLLPNSSAVRSALHDAELAIQRWFFGAFKGELNLVTAALEAGESLYRDYNRWHTDITSLLQVAKKKKSLPILSEVFSGRFKPADYSSFRTQLFSDEKIVLEKCGNEYERYIFHLNNLFEKTGMHIPKSKYLVQWYTRDGVSYPYSYSGKSVIPFAPLGICWTFAESEKELAAIVAGIRSDGAEHIRCFLLNDTYSEEDRKHLSAALYDTKSGTPVVLGFRVLGNAAPKGKEQEVLEYIEIAKKDNTGEIVAELRYPLLGILRMDVDNLGAVFGFGLSLPGKGKGIETLSRVVNLSRDLNLFFLGYLNTLAEKRNIYITYSGGDDLFVVGSWINCLEFVQDVRSAFSKYAGNNPSLTISAGLYFCKPSFPVHRAAEFAGEWLEAAKKASPAKSCIKVFDRIMNWKDFGEQLDYAKEFDALVGIEGKDAVKPSHLHFLMGNIQQMYDGDKNEIKIAEMYRLIGKIKYSLSHSSRKVNKTALDAVAAGSPDVSKKVRAYSKILLNTDQQKYLKYFIFPASYVIFKHRESKNKGAQSV